MWSSNAYYLNLSINAKVLEPIIYKVDNNTTIDIKDKLTLYYKRLNHLNKDYIIKTIKDFTINTYNNSNNTLKTDNNCESCKLGKTQEKPSYIPLKALINKLTYFDIDICGPFRTKGINNESYFFTFTCYTTRAIQVYAIKYKLEAIDILIKFYNLILN